MNEFAQLRVGMLSVIQRLPHQPSGRLVLASIVRAAGELERDDRVDETLLRCVV